MWLLHKYEAHIKGLPICFSEVQVKNDVTDNNNKHFVTAFEGECRNIIELREHLKLCFLIILYIQWALMQLWRHTHKQDGSPREMPLLGDFICIYSTSLQMRVHLNLSVGEGHVFFEGGGLLLL